VLHGKGTTLSIKSLRDTWTAERFERLKLAVSRLVSPGFATDADDFSIILDIDGHRERISSAIDRSRAMYSIQGRVKEDGSCEISYTDLSGVKEQWERSVLWPREADSNCGTFSFQINAWDLDREPLLHYLKKTGSRLGLRDFRRSLRDHSGISLYRDGFRILPYGESDNDWLRLDRRRVNNPTMRLSNNQILGWIQLTADGNPLLRDQTNREGLVTNGAYEHIREVVIELLGYLENRRFSARRTMGIQAKGGGSQAPGLEDAQSRRIETLLSGIGQQAASETALNELKGLIESRQQQMEDLVRFHVGLATTGRMAGIVFTQLRHCLRQFETEIKLIRRDLSYDEIDEDSLTDLRSGFVQMQELVADMHTRMDRLDPVATTRKGRRVSKTTLGMCITPILDTFEEALVKAEIQHRLHGDWRTEVTTNVSVVQQALCCIFENALEWLVRSDERRILDIRLSQTGITIANSGPAIAEEHRELLFEPHFSTTGSAGLGLTLAQSLMKGIGGQVQCVSVERGAEFRVVFGG
jgi:signal transduction histidine kinase